MRIVKDYSVITTYGFCECPTCGATFYGGGLALHTKPECAKDGYENCIYHVGTLCPEWEEVEDLTNEVE